MKKIPRFKPSLTVSEIVTAVASKREDGRNYLDTFTEAFARYIGVQCAVFVPSARVGLAGLLHALDLPKGGEVILPALTHQSIAKLFEDFGLAVRYVDIDSETYCLDIDQAKLVLNSMTVAIVPVHIYGRACDMTQISQIARDNNLAIIEDCAQACGSSYSGKRLGSFGRGAIFSLGPFKHVCALGAGMVVTDEPEVADKISSYVSQLPRLGTLGLFKRLLFTIGVCTVTKPVIWSFLMAPVLQVCNAFGFDLIGKMTTETPGKKATVTQRTQSMPRPLQGIVGMSQLAKLDEFNLKRIRNGNGLLKRLQGVKNIRIPTSAPTGENVYLSCAIQVNEPDQFRRRMLAYGVDTHSGDKTFVSGVTQSGSSQECKVAQTAIQSMVHLPVYPQLDETEISHIAEAVQWAADGHQKCMNRECSHEIA